MRRAMAIAPIIIRCSLSRSHAGSLSVSPSARLRFECVHGVNIVQTRASECLLSGNAKRFYGNEKRALSNKHARVSSSQPASQPASHQPPIDATKFACCDREYSANAKYVAAGALDGWGPTHDAIGRTLFHHSRRLNANQSCGININIFARECVCVCVYFSYWRVHGVDIGVLACEACVRIRRL